VVKKEEVKTAAVKAKVVPKKVEKEEESDISLSESGDEAVVEKSEKKIVVTGKREKSEPEVKVPEKKVTKTRSHL